MVAYFVLLLAVLSRILPHSLHAVSWNFTAVGGSLLLFGSRMRARSGSRWVTAAKLASALAVLAATDYYLTVFAYQYPFQLNWYIGTWVWYGAVCLMGMEFLAKPTVLRVGIGAVASATSFFFISNFMVWMGAKMYPPTLAGLGACYVAGIPFYRNDLVSTALTAGVLFGLPALASKLAEALGATENRPLA